jgi:lysophospholipase L1-like esterase
MKIRLWPLLLAASTFIILALFCYFYISPYLFSSHASAKASSDSKSILIMPLGDSITYGEGSTYLNGYRLALQQHLTAAGIQFTFVGSVHAGSMPFSESANEGHPGWRIAQISARIVGWLQTYRPNYILLQIGTNDVVYHDHLAQAPARLKALLDTITSTLPNVNVLVAEITPLAPPREALAEAYNSTIPGIVQSEVAQGKHIEVVDMHDAVPLGALLPDKIHPDDTGYALMANVWYQALYPLLVPHNNLVPARQPTPLRS